MNESALALKILAVGLGDERASELWNHWTDAERAEVSALADEAFLPILEQLADDIVTWNQRGYGLSQPRPLGRPAYPAHR